MTLTDAITDYLRFIKYERGLSETTHATYQSWLRNFALWLEGNGYPDPALSAFTTPVLRRFLYALQGRGYRPRTIRGVFHPLRGLGEFLVEAGALEVNPCKALTMPKLDAARRQEVSTEEILALLSAAERLPHPRQMALSRAMLCVIVYCGLRAQELLDLRLCDVRIDGKEKTLTVAQGKGKKARMLHPAPECAAALAEWLAMRGKDCRHDWLWAQDKGRRVAYGGLIKALEDVKAVAGLRGAGNIKPHALRHAFASRMMNNGAPIKAIQAALGHSDAKTTFLYLHMEEQQTRLMAQYAALTSLPAPAPSSVNKPGQQPQSKPHSKAAFLSSRRRTTR